MRVFYVDDSGDEQISVIAAITFEFEQWPKVLRDWLGWRRWLRNEYELPVDFELHAQPFISGHDEIPPLENADPAPAISTTLGIRREAYRRCLEQIGRQEEVAVVAIARKNQTVKDVYSEFVSMVDGWLVDRNEQGICIVDGKDDSSYRPGHRALDLKTRALIEDPLMQSSAHSQPVQMADLVSYAAFQHVAEAPSKRFMKPWYREILGDSILDLDEQVSAT